MKKFFLLIPILFLALTGCKKQLSFDEKCQAEAKAQTLKVCPRVITPGIRIDSITYTIPDHTMRYYYTMSNDYDNPDNLAPGKERFREALHNQIINSIDLKKLKDRGISFRYIYYSQSTKEVLLDELFTKSDYNQ